MTQASSHAAGRTQGPPGPPQRCTRAGDLRPPLTWTLLSHVASCPEDGSGSERRTRTREGRAQQSLGTHRGLHPAYAATHQRTRELCDGSVLAPESPSPKAGTSVTDRQGVWGTRGVWRPGSRRACGPDVPLPPCTARVTWCEVAGPLLGLRCQARPSVVGPHASWCAVSRARARVSLVPDALPLSLPLSQSSLRARRGSSSP